MRQSVFFHALKFFLLPVAAAIMLNGCTGKLPSKEELKSIQHHTASHVYSADDILLGKYFIENRTNARFDEISPDIINALIATEDARFYNHDGVDTRSAFRVMFKSILMGDEKSGGGSTISQQLAKNLYPRKKGFMAMFRNKMREIKIAFRLEDVYSKDELLTLYLNTVSFGEEVYGISAATERYFSVSPAGVNAQQAAMLVGLLKAPGTYNPRLNPELALQRRNTVIGQMKKYNYITAEAADSLKALPLDLQYNKLTHETGLAPYFREMTRLHLDKALKVYNEKNGTSYNLYTDGLKIETTLDARMQEYAEKAVRAHLAELQKTFNNEWKHKKPWDDNPKLLEDAVAASARYKLMKDKGFSKKEIDEKMKQPVKMKIFSRSGAEETEMSPLDSVKYHLMLLHAGLFAIDPHSGHVKAWVGGLEYAHFKYDHVTAKRQAGSTFKPVLYASALENGIPPCEKFANEKRVYAEYENWSPENANRQYGGYYTMQGALTHSVNTVSAALILETGIRNVTQTAAALGIETKLPQVPSLALGSAEVPLHEMTTAYCAFANGGKKTEPVFILRVTDKDGNVIIDNSKQMPQRRALTASTALTMNHFLRGVADSGTASSLRSLYGLYFDIAGKTGTTQNHADGWFIGYTPDLVCGVWVGADNPQVHFQSLTHGQGAKMALPVWALFMQQLTSDKKFMRLKLSRFPEPDAGLLASLDCPMYRDDLSFWEKLFGQKEAKPQRAPAKKIPAPSKKQEKPAARERIKNFFGKKNK